MTTTKVLRKNWRNLKIGVGEETKTIPDRCSNKACPNHRSDKKK